MEITPALVVNSTDGLLEIAPPMRCMDTAGGVHTKIISLHKVLTSFISGLDSLQTSVCVSLCGGEELPAWFGLPATEQTASVSQSSEHAHIHVFCTLT